MKQLKLGFTLVELLVSISIIATLLSFLLPNLMGSREKAKDAQKKQDLTSIKNALRLFYNDTQDYPALGNSLSSVPANANLLGSTLASYMPAVANIGYTYYYYGLGDSFYLWAPTEAAKADELGTSQLNCGLSVGQTMANIYMVCAK